MIRTNQTLKLRSSRWSPSFLQGGNSRLRIGWSPVGDGGGYPLQPQGGADGGTLDQDEHGYGNRNNGNVPPGGRGGGISGGGRGNRGNNSGEIVETRTMVNSGT